jgi:O-glycosyl hydrolase
MAGALPRRRIRATTTIALATIGLAAPLPLAAQAPEQPVEVVLRPATDRPGTRFEGWGTALAWFAHVTGGWPESERKQLADLFYRPDGLGWTIARYNIGGGNAADTPPYLRPGADIPGFWRKPAGAQGTEWWRAGDEGMWNWSADARQRWWLDAVRARVREPIFEAFSNSPPWFMTVSGRVSGARKATDDNLQPGKEQPFAEYLARVVEVLQKRHRIAFRTLSPFNEPNTDYWHFNNRQEGSHWSPARQVMMIEAASTALRARGLRTVLSAPDETNSHLFLRNWSSYPPSARALVGQLNVHSYGTVHQTGVRDAARASGIRLWMSEDDTPLDKDPEDFEGIASALAFAEHVVMDLKRLEPAAWVFWQAVEDLSARGQEAGSNWGLVKADLRAPANGRHAIHVTRKYWAMAQFSRFIRPGDRLVPVDDLDTVGALSADGRRLVLVHVNGGLNPRRLVLPSGWRSEAVITDADRELACVAGTVAPRRSITTLILTQGTGPRICAARGAGTAPLPLAGGSNRPRGHSS